MMKKILSMILLAGLFYSCKQSVVITTKEDAPIDSLMSNWNKAWSEHDSAAVINSFASKDLVLTDEKLVATTTTDISEKWIHVYMGAMKDMKTEKLQEWSSGDRAGYTGKYAFDVVVKDSLVAQPKGIFTMIWIKTPDAGWKLTTFNAHGL